MSDFALFSGENALIGTMTANYPTISTRNSPGKSGMGYVKLFSPIIYPATRIMLQGLPYGGLL
jgi:hypothetical protein